MLPSPLQTWRDRGRFIQVFGREVFVVTAGPEEAPPLLILHGFPTSSQDFAAALPRLAARHRVIVHDHLGFGLSAKPEDYSYSLFEQADVALGVWRQLGITGGHLLAHDYGTSVATELCARRERGLLPLQLRSLTLCNGSIYIHLADLTLSQRLSRNPTFGPLVARAMTRGLFDLQIRRILGRPEAVSAEDLAVMWAGIRHRDGHLRVPAVQQYLVERARFHGRWIGGLRALDIPAHVLWAREDPVSIPAIAEAVAGDIPGARLSWLEGLGHYPMVEDPQRWADAALAFLDPLEPSA